jgi:hypothetical protein
VGYVERLEKTKGKYRIFLSVNLRAKTKSVKQRCPSFGAGGTFDTFLGMFAKL